MGFLYGFIDLNEFTGRYLVLTPFDPYQYLFDQSKIQIDIQIDPILPHGRPLPNLISQIQIQLISKSVGLPWDLPPCPT